MKRDLIMLHGALSDRSQFDAFEKHLNDSFKCHALTLPGHGENADREGVFSMTLFSDFVIQYIRDHHLNSPLIFGYSMGGYVGLKLAGDEAGLISGLITMATKLDWNTETASKEVSQLQPSKMVEKIPAFVETLKVLHGPGNWEQVVMKTAALMGDLGKQPLREEDFSKISCHVLNMVGDSDRMVDALYSEQVTSLIPCGRFRLLENTPHPFEKADLLLLTAILKEFVSELK
jgi:pimeloyl-ACP methyl ester carboxylesterase